VPKRQTESKGRPVHISSPKNNTSAGAAFHPMQEVLIPKRPKLPIDQAPASRGGWTPLEGAEKEFYALIAKSFRLAVEDARRTIILNDPTLHS
jgi:hypothetical protein